MNADDVYMEQLTVDEPTRETQRVCDGQMDWDTRVSVPCFCTLYAYKGDLVRTIHCAEHQLVSLRDPQSIVTWFNQQPDRTMTVRR